MDYSVRKVDGEWRVWCADPWLLHLEPEQYPGDTAGLEQAMAQVDSYQRQAEATVARVRAEAWAAIAKGKEEA